MSAAASALRARADTIIALTGYAQQDRERADERSFDSYVVKPCPHPELLKLLDRVLADAGPRL